MPIPLHRDTLLILYKHAFTMIYRLDFPRAWVLRTLTCHTIRPSDCAACWPHFGSGSQSIPVGCPVHGMAGSVQYVEAATVNGQLPVVQAEGLRWYVYAYLMSNMLKVPNQFQ